MPYGWLALIVPAAPVLCAGFLLLAALHDIAARTVPNWVAVAVALGGLAARLVDGHLLPSLAAAAAAFVVTAFCWRRGWLGGADVKLIAAATLAVPNGQIGLFIVAMSFSGSILAILYLVGGRIARAAGRDARLPRPTNLLARAARAELWRLRRGGPLPYACAIAAGFTFVLF